MNGSGAYFEPLGGPWEFLLGSILASRVSLARRRVPGEASELTFGPLWGYSWPILGSLGEAIWRERMGVFKCF